MIWYQHKTRLGILSLVTISNQSSSAHVEERDQESLHAHFQTRKRRGRQCTTVISFVPHGMCGTSQITDYFYVGWNKDHLNHDFTEVMESNHAVKNMIYVMDHITSQDVPVYVLFGGCQWLLIFPMKVFFSAGAGAGAGGVERCMRGCSTCCSCNLLWEVCSGYDKHEKIATCLCF